MAAHAVLRVVAQRHAVDKDIAALRVVEAGHELAQGRLSAARRAYQSHRLALADGERYVVQHLARLVVTERHSAELDLVAELVERARVGFVGHFAAGVEYREDAFARGDALVDVGELVDERAQRTRDLRECGDERYEACGRQCAAARDDQVAAVDQNDAHGDDAQKLAHGRGQLLAPRHRYHQTREVGVDAPELLDQIVGRVVALDDLYARQRLVEHAYHVAHALLSALCGVAQALNDIAYDKTHDRQEQHRE